jgi:hypothetical protein
MGRVDKLHKGKTNKAKGVDNSSMEEILGKKALKVKNNKKNGNKKSKNQKKPLNKLLATIAIFLVLLTGGYLAFHYIISGSISNAIPFAPKTIEFGDGEVNYSNIRN